MIMWLWRWHITHKNNRWILLTTARIPPWILVADNSRNQGTKWQLTDPIWTVSVLGTLVCTDSASHLVVDCWCHCVEQQRTPISRTCWVLCPEVVGPFPMQVTPATMWLPYVCLALMNELSIQVNDIKGHSSAVIPAAQIFLQKQTISWCINGMPMRSMFNSFYSFVQVYPQMDFIWTSLILCMKLSLQCTNFFMKKV
jgi:hypothetical protein